MLLLVLQVGAMRERLGLGLAPDTYAALLPALAAQGSERSGGSEPAQLTSGSAPSRDSMPSTGTLAPSPYTLAPSPYTLAPSPYALPLSPYTSEPPLELAPLPN